MAACFEVCLLKFSPAALCYRLRSRTKVFCYPLCLGESLSLVFLIFVAEEELDFGCFSFRGEAMKPSRLTRGFLSLVNSYSRRVFCFFYFFVAFYFLRYLIFLFLLDSFPNYDCEIIQLSKAPNLDTDRTDSWSKWFCFETKSMETISYEFFVI